MKKIFTLILICFALSAKADYWTQKTDFGGTSRAASVAFSIGTKAYVGTGGYCGWQVDFWEYNPATNVWTQKADFGGPGRTLASAFSIGAKGYVGLGSGGSTIYYDLWEYDPSSNTWTQKTNFSGVARNSAIAFSIGTKAYAGGGCQPFNLTPYNDFWEYNPLTDSWSQKADFPSSGRLSIVCFSIGTKGYAGIGTGDGGIPWPQYNDFWEYDPVLNIWSQKANFPGTSCFGAAGFSIGTKGYVGLGSDSLGIFHNEFWEYDPTIDTWTQKTNFAGVGRERSSGFSIGVYGYVTLGIDSNYNRYSDLWEYTPGNTTGIDEFINNNFQFSISPNPAKEFLVITSDFTAKEKMKLIITNVQGKKVFATQLETKTLNFKLQTSNFSNGIYFVEINNGKEKAVKKFIKN